jgi:hypothetical protein
MASRRDYLRTLAGVSFAGGGCVARRQGTAAVHAQLGASPGAFAPFETCRLDITGIAVEPDGGAFETYDVGTVTIDLTSGGDPWSVARIHLAAEGYERLQFDVAGVEATLADGSPAPIAPFGGDTITVGESFRVRTHVNTTLTAILTVVEAEATGRYGLRAVPDFLRVSYTDGPRTHTLTAVDG